MKISMWDEFPKKNMGAIPSKIACFLHRVTENTDVCHNTLCHAFNTTLSAFNVATYIQTRYRLRSPESISCYTLHTTHMLAMSVCSVGSFTTSNLKTTQRRRAPEDKHTWETFLPKAHLDNDTWKILRSICRKPNETLTMERLELNSDDVVCGCLQYGSHEVISLTT